MMDINVITEIGRGTRLTYFKEWFLGHDSSYYGVPTHSPIDVKRHFEQQDGRNDDGADLGGLEHAAIIT